MLLLLPHAGENGPLFVEHCIERGHGHRIFFDSLDNPHFILQLISLAQSDSLDPYEKQMMREMLRDALIELVGRNRKEQIDQQPLVIELATKAIELWLSAECNTTIDHLLAVGKYQHRLYDELLQSCNDADLIRYWTTFPRSPNAMRELAALWRLMDQKFAYLQIRQRSDKGRLLEELLEDRCLVVVEGGQSARATATYLGLLSMMAMQIIRKKFIETGKPFPTLIVADEVSGFNLFSGLEKKAIQQLPKAGLNYIAISHSIRLLADPDENAEALNSFVEVRGHRCAEWSTADGIARMAGGTLDPYQVHHVDMRTVQRHEGFSDEPYNTVTRAKGMSGENPTMNESTSEGWRSVPRYREDTESTTHYFGLEDQFKSIASRIMRLGMSEYVSISNGNVRWCKTPYIPRPWKDDAERQMTEFLATLHSRPEYVRPSIITIDAKSSKPTSDADPQPPSKSSNGSKQPESKKGSTPSEVLRDVLRRSSRKKPAE
ncbi:MAG: hypothetical protein QM775_31125 [Pirellulales bacterium]